MKVSNEILIADLIDKTKANLNQAEKFKQLDSEALNYRGAADKWSVLECVEHLNLYGDYYLLEIESRMKAGKDKRSTQFKSGVLGNYFAKMMEPKKDFKKMKTPKDKNPIGSRLDSSVIEKFIEQQYKTLSLLDTARVLSLSKIKTSISISKVVKLKLGDTFRFIINHNERHLKQANDVLNNRSI